MKPRNLFAYDKTGSVIVTAHGSELVTASASDGSLLWQKKRASEIVGVASTEEEVVCLDSEGNLVWYRSEDGAENDVVSVKGKLHWLAVDVDGVAAVIAGGKVKIIDPGDSPREIGVEGARRVAWSPDGTRFAVGTKGGAVLVFDEESLEEIGSSELGTSVTSLAFGGGGLYATAGTKLYALDEDGERRQTVRVSKHEAEGALDSLSCSEDGNVVAVRAGANTGLVLRPDGEVIAVVRVPDRELLGVALGPRPWLGVAGDRGEATRVNLRSGSVKPVERGEAYRGGGELRVEVDLKSPLTSRKKGKEARRASLPRSEREVNSPDWQTITYFGIVAGMSLLLWGSARFACNAHPPTSLKPREVGTVELASRPKDAAIELFQRLELKDFDGALELVKGQSQTAVEKAKQECGANISRCEAEKKSRVGQVLTTADLISHSGNTAKAKVTSLVKGEPPRTYEVELEQDGPIWKATRHVPMS